MAIIPILSLLVAVLVCFITYWLNRRGSKEDRKAQWLSDVGELSGTAFYKIANNPLWAMSLFEIRAAIDELTRLALNPPSGLKVKSRTEMLSIIETLASIAADDYEVGNEGQKLADLLERLNNLAKQ